MINRWQRGVPVDDQPLITWPFLLLLVMAIVGFVLHAFRAVGPLAPFAAMTDVYPWGIWKTFNVMTLTALGSGGLAIGIAAWVFNRHHLHIVMRTALLTSFLLYATGMIGILVDMGRPWNFYHVIFFDRWNTHSSLLEVAVCMTFYVTIFLAFENLPSVLERFQHTGSAKTRQRIDAWTPTIKKIYPYMIAGAYILPMMHQSSLGALMLSAGHKVHPLWQSQMLPLLYVVQAAVCGFAFVIFILILSCVLWRRPLDEVTLAELGSGLSWLAIGWIVLRVVDIAARGVLPLTLRGDLYGNLFLLEFMLVLLPALVLQMRSVRTHPALLFDAAVLIATGGMLYRFIPTTLAYRPNAVTNYFPSLPEAVITIALLSLAGVGYLIAVKKLAILPAPLAYWYRSTWTKQDPSAPKVEAHGYAAHH